MITLQNITLQRGRKVLFDRVSLSLFFKQKVGLVGMNGSGKSSLFAMLLGQLQPDSGDLIVQSNLRIAHLSQEMPHTDRAAIQYVMDGDKELVHLLQKIKQSEEKQDGLAVSELHSRLYSIDGYAAESRAARLLDGLGFKSIEYEEPVNIFSGGWRMRLNLAQVLMSRSDLLLLDEPTNHLDIDAIVWLESWLQKYSGSLLLISHDREFLDNVIDKTVHIHNHKLNLYSGNYSSFEEQRAEILMREKAMAAKQQAEIEHTTKFICRFRAKASKAKQVQSRLKVLERMQKVTITHLDSPFSFRFYESKRCLGQLLYLESVSFDYEDKVIFDRMNFTLNSGDRIGLLGPNGVGKSTLIKLLNGMLQVSQGYRHVNKALKIGYFAQHQVDQLNTEDSAFLHLKQLNEKAREQDIRDFLGGFGFRGDRIFESIESFSGGEKARLVLAMLVWQHPNLLLLDEPTNHLDLDMREALTYALQDYAGALVVVSHDRYLLKSVVDEFYLVNGQKVSEFKGDLNDYQAWLLENKKQQNKDNKVTSLSNATGVKQKQVSEREMRQLESKLQNLHVEEEGIGRELSESSLYQENNQEKLAEHLKELERIKKEIACLEERWVEWAE